MTHVLIILIPTHMLIVLIPRHHNTFQRISL